MPFDPAKPATNAEIESAELRAQFNGLKDLIDAIPAGPQGPQGDPGPMPPTNPFIAQGRIISENGDLSIVTSDAGNSGEEGLRIRNNGGRLLISRRSSGNDQEPITLDFAGLDDGAGSPSVQDGDLYRYDAATQTIKPTRRLGTLFADLTTLTAPISDPPTQAEVQANRDRLNEFLTRLQAM